MDEGLQKIQLPSFVLADFYRDALVVLDDATPTSRAMEEEKETVAAATIAPPDPIETPAFTNHQPVKQYLGDNKKNIAIIVSDSNAVYLNEESLNFLSTILGACKLNLGDVAIINQQNQPQDFNRLKENLSARQVILFEVLPSDIGLPFSIPHYQLQQYNNCQILSCPPLTVMLDNSQEAKLEKSRLWLSLKKMFGI